MTNRDLFAEFINSKEFDSMDDFGMTASDIHQMVILMIKDINDRMEREGNDEVLRKEIGKFKYKVISSVASWSANGILMEVLPPDMEFEDVNLDEAVLEISYHELVNTLKIYGQLLAIVLRYVSEKFDQ